MGAGSVKMIGFAVDGIHGSADYLAPGAIEINRYQQEIYDKVRRRFYFGQRIQQVLATGYPSRYFEQQTIPVAAFTKPRILAATASQPKRVERFLILKAIMSQINYGIFDSEIVSQQGQFEGLQAKDLEDGGAGVRAQAMLPDGAMVDDFKIVRTDGAVHVLNAPSPAATASLCIGEQIAEMALS